MSTKNRKPSNPAKTTVPASKTSTAQSRKASASTGTPASSAAPSGLVRIHDMLGTVVLLLPQALRERLGEEAYRDCVTAAQNQAMTLIVRSPDDVIYVDLPIFVIDGKSPTGSSQPAVTPAANAMPAAKKPGRH